MIINLCLDSNYLLYKAVFILKKTRTLKQDLESLLYSDFNKLSKNYTFDNIYFVSDSTMSWRKMEYPEYKGNREKDDTIDWKFVYKTFEDFKSNIKKLPNVKFLEQSGLEGDDLIAHIIHETNKLGESNVIVSSDCDLNQLLSYDLNKSCINIQWNNKYSDERLYLPQNYQLLFEKLENETSDNIFDSDNSSDFLKYIESLIQRTKVKSIIPEEIIFKKIVCGDTGDNVPTLIKIKDGKYDQNGRGIGKDGADTVYKYYKDMYPGDIDFKSSSFVNNLIEIVIYYKKIKQTDLKEQMRKNILFNIKMMVLDPEYMPTKVYENMNQYFTEVRNDIKTNTLNLEKILEEKGFSKKESTEFIPEKFRIETENNDSFDLDDYWEL
ncbi:hypothetical protein M0Q50_04500 [bacterium]|jgi:hypothetical protein|nr:hypothetical protein [bacterium]